MQEAKYKRILLKISGEVLAGQQRHGLDFEKVNSVCSTVKKCVEAGAQIEIVVGGGNIWRGRSSGSMDRTRADHMGMLATVINALALADSLESMGVAARVQTGIHMQEIAEPYIRGKAVRHMEKGRVVIYGCGTGNPFFSTDTGAALRAVETDADIIFKATNVNGVYDSDPNKNPNAKMFKTLSFMDIIEKNLNVMDLTAATMCRDNNMPILVFNLNDPENIYRGVMGEDIGTIVK